jgi:Uma2 family endonuclease
MSVSTVKPWTVEEFFAWGAAQEGRYEFDGVRPVAMTGGTINHSLIVDNIKFALRSRLRGTPCAAFGPEVGVSTIGTRIRYPDALVTCSKFAGTERLVPNPIVMFEVLSPDSGRRDRIEKLREYAAVPSIRHYIIVESTSIGATSLRRNVGDLNFQSEPLTERDMLSLAAIEIEIPLGEFYDGVDFGPGLELPR